VASPATPLTVSRDDQFDRERNHMSLFMNRSEREAFLADVHVGILGVSSEDRGPLMVPVWYTYEPGSTVNVITGENSRKGRLISSTGRFSLCTQTEVAPYKYVSVEGPVVQSQKPIDPQERRVMAHRYLGEEFGDLYLQANANEEVDSITFRMQPDVWLTSDFAKEFG
jgi:nitroimidazol reductase NimA-like FMN-containing flavoprotein (pyridoxamine 5'-phosphate oxidase superfamily)